MLEHSEERGQGRARANYTSTQASSTLFNEPPIELCADADLARRRVAVYDAVTSAPKLVRTAVERVACGQRIRESVNDVNMDCRFPRLSSSATNGSR